MFVAEKKPVPIYEATCDECESKIQYKRSEVSSGYIICPVCGVAIWADANQFVRYEEGE